MPQQEPSPTTPAPLSVRPFQEADEAAVIALWGRCGLIRPWNDPRKDIRRKLQVQPELFLVGLLVDELVASVMAGYEGHRGWLNYLAVAPERQGLGLGRQIVARAEDGLRAAGCPKINLLVRSGNQQVIAFYERLGYRLDQVVCLGKRLEHDEPPGELA
jgi:ribosomal protein S18 acetylase RimI-like enzyme